MSCCGSCAQGKACEDSPDAPASFSFAPFSMWWPDGRVAPLAGQKKAPKRFDPDRFEQPLTQCDPLPWLPERVADAWRSAVAAGETDANTVALTVLFTVYPTTRSRQPIPWSTIAAGVDPCLLELRRLVFADIAARFAQWDLTTAQARYSAVLRDRQ